MEGEIESKGGKEREEGRETEKERGRERERERGREDGKREKEGRERKKERELDEWFITGLKFLDLLCMDLTCSSVNPNGSFLVPMSCFLPLSHCPRKIVPTSVFSTP